VTRGIGVNVGLIVFIAFNPLISRDLASLSYLVRAAVKVEIVEFGCRMTIQSKALLAGPDGGSGQRLVPEVGPERPFLGVSETVVSYFEDNYEGTVFLHQHRMTWEHHGGTSTQ
jgi:hypothetical protein